MIVLEAKSEPRSGSMGSGGSSPSGEQGRSPASNSHHMSFVHRIRARFWAWKARRELRGNERKPSAIHRKWLRSRGVL